MNIANYPDKLTLSSHEIGYVESVIILSKKLKLGTIKKKIAIETYAKHENEIRKSVSGLIASVDDAINCMKRDYSLIDINIVTLENMVNLYTALSNLNIPEQNQAEKLEDYKKVLIKLLSKETFHKEIDLTTLNELEIIVNMMRNDLISKSRSTGKRCRYSPSFE